MSVTSSKTIRVVSEIGSVYEQYFSIDSDISNWSKVSSGGVDTELSVSGGRLEVTRAAATPNLDDYWVYDGYEIVSDSFTVRYEYNVGTVNGSNTPLTFGFETTTNARIKCRQCRLNIINVAAAAGALVVYTNPASGTGSFQTTNPATSIDLQSNDTIIVTVSKKLDVITYSFFNTRTEELITDSTLNHDLGAGVNGPQPCKIMVGALGNAGANTTAYINNITLTIDQPSNADIMWVGDSLTVSGFVDDNLKKWNRRIQKDSSLVFAKFAGGGNRVEYALNQINGIIGANPKRVLLWLGTNDKAAGTSDATLRINYNNLVTQLENAGIEVAHVTPLPRNGITVTGHRANLITDYGSTGKVLDMFLSWESSSTAEQINATYSSDGVHITTDDGQERLAGQINVFLKRIGWL